MIVRRIGVAAVAAIAATLMLAQFMQPMSGNSPVKDELNAPSQILTTLRHSCFDCHSNETRWPWYSRLPPVSWLVAHDVARGRQELNYSEWNSYFPQTRTRKLQWMERALRTEKMPPMIYRIIHPESRLSDADRDALINWIETQLTAPASSCPPAN
jgi:Haem-binding domain